MKKIISRYFFFSYEIFETWGVFCSSYQSQLGPVISQALWQPYVASDLYGQHSSRNSINLELGQHG